MTVVGVVCLGDLMTDVVARLPGPLATGSDTPARIGLYGGGSAANTACWLASAGVPVAFVGCVGDDSLGRAAVAELRAAGVRVEVRVDPARPTGTCIVLVAPSGERTMVPDAGANSGLPEPPADLLGADTWLHVSGYALLNRSARPAALAALAAARAAGAAVSVDAASAAPLAAAGAETFLSWLGTGLLLIANADEARVLTGQAAPLTAAGALAAARLLADRCGTAIVKCGGDGAVWAAGGQSGRVPATRVEPVDTTGAGDAFAAGVIAGRRTGLDLADAIARGHRLAARAVTRLGARPVS